MPPHRNAADVDGLFRRACALWDRGELAKAHDLLLGLAERGDSGAQLNVGYFFDTGLGVRKNVTKALYWYRRAYQQGNGSAANNIGTVWRDRGRKSRAIAWFKRAVRLGEVDSGIEIAKLLMERGSHRDAMRYLRKVIESEESISEASAEEARTLVRRLLSTSIRHLGRSARHPRSYR
jgi:TPR repeat protein